MPSRRAITFFQRFVKWVVNPLMFFIHSQTVLRIVSTQTFHSFPFQVLSFERILNLCKIIPLFFNLWKIFLPVSLASAPYWRIVLDMGSRWRGACN